MKMLVGYVHMPHWDIGHSGPVLWLERLFTSKLARLIAAVTIALLFLLLVFWLSSGGTGSAVEVDEPFSFYWL
jgi:hypothetical protein